MTVSAILFDIDGTLVDSNGWHVRAWREAFADHGHDIADDRIAAEIGKGGDLLVPTLLPDAPEEEQEAIADAHDGIFKSRYLDRVEPFPHSRDLIERVHARGAKVVLASSASKAELDHYVELLGIADFVAASTTSEDVGTSKPAPDIFAVAVERAGAPDTVLAVGDSPYDIESAGKAGMATIAVLSGGFPRERLADAKAIYADVGELLERLEDSPLAG
jgi:membrane protein